MQTNKPLTEEQLREKIAKLLDKEFENYANPIHSALMQLGWVQLAGDQTPPPNKMSYIQVIGEPTITEQVQAEIKREIEIWTEAQQDMLAIKDGWAFRRVRIQEG